MTLAQTKRLANHFFRLLKVSDIAFPIARTNKGSLEIKFTDQRDDFDIMLDAVPLPTLSIVNDDKNIELKNLVEKYWFEQPIGIGDLAQYVDNGTTTVNVGRVFKSDFQGNKGKDVTDEFFGKKNKGGRPKGSKNKAKQEDKVNG